MASLVLIDEGALRVLPPDGMQLRLFTNNPTITHASIESDFAWASGGGGNALTLSQTSWSATINNQTNFIALTYPAQIYTFSGDATYYGFAYVLSNNYVYFAAKFDTPWAVTNGTQKYITPYLQVSNFNTGLGNITNKQGVSRGSLSINGQSPMGLFGYSNATHLMQNVILGNLLISGGVPGHDKVVGVPPTAFTQAVTLGLVNILGKTPDNRKLIGGTSLVQGVTMGSITPIGSILGNIKTQSVNTQIQQGVNAGSLGIIGGTPNTTKATTAASGETIYANAGDEDLSTGGSVSWASVRGATTAQYGSRTASVLSIGAYNGYNVDEYEETLVARSFVDFTIPAGSNFSTVSLKLYVEQMWDGTPKISAQSSSHDTTQLVLGDFDNFASAPNGTSLGQTAAVTAVGQYTISTTALKDAVNALRGAGGTMKLCLREYEHDFSNVAPLEADYSVTITASEGTTQANRPQLVCE